MYRDTARTPRDVIMRGVSLFFPRRGLLSFVIFRCEIGETVLEGSDRSGETASGTKGSIEKDGGKHAASVGFVVGSGLRSESCA